MASLTQTAYQTRRVINWTILIVILYFIGKLILSFLIAVWSFLFPQRPPPPNHGFNKLPAIAFPAPTTQPATPLTYTLETVSGGLPSASESARVYFMPKTAPNLLAISRAQEFARNWQFDPTPYQESRTVYRFDDLQYPLRKLRYDIVSNNFIMKYGYEQDTGLFLTGTIRDPNLAEKNAVRFLDSKDLYVNDFVNGTSNVTNLRLVGNSLIPVENLSQTDAMRVDFFRSSVNTLGVVTPHPDEGQIRVTYSGASDPKKQQLEVIYTYWPIDYQTFATYSLKPVSQAWQELQDGKGYIAKYPTNRSQNAVIRNVYLAYYDSFEPQTYLQPVYVFQGDHNFTAYIHAIPQEWVE